MTSPIQRPGVQPQGTSLAPARPFGDAGTLTLPRRRQARERAGGILLVAAPGRSEHGLRAAIVRLDAQPLTLTLSAQACMACRRSREP